MHDLLVARYVASRNGFEEGQLRLSDEPLTVEAKNLLRGFFEAPQFLVYRDTEGGHYDWHLDRGREAPRKLSLTIQLTDPSRYEGCELEFNIGGGTLSTPRSRGHVIAFPSYMIHRVTPITSGVRKAIVAWVTGPEFK